MLDRSWELRCTWEAGCWTSTGNCDAHGMQNVGQGLGTAMHMGCRTLDRNWELRCTWDAECWTGPGNCDAHGMQNVVRGREAI
eukprot:1161925-Pelagomonas_calceolata.AAC.9